MADILKIAVAPIDIAYGDKVANLVTAASLIDRLDKDTDIVLLPELFTTAFIKNRDKALSLSETNDGETMNAVSQWAATKNCAIAGSFLATDGEGRLFNRGFFAAPEGQTTFYDKKHLFTLSGESDLFTPGRHHFEVCSFRGWNVMMMVCYDLRFPIWCRNIDLKYDLMLFSANWGGSRAYAFKHLLIARAIENQACVAGCNRLGSDAYGEYPEGMSDVYDCMGRPVGALRDGIVYGSVSLEKTKMSRMRFPAYLDVDRITLSGE